MPHPYPVLIAGLFGLALAVNGRAGADQPLVGEVRIDGSSTVYPISEAVAVAFRRHHPAVNIVVGQSGTGGGFKRFARGDTDISDASRPIKDSEVKEAAANGIDFVELKVGLDGLAVIIHKDNDWARKLTVAQLKKIWHPNADGFRNASRWNELDPSWPDEKIELYGPGTDSGTFDYFTEAVCGKSGKSRSDYGASEDDNTTINGVVRGKYALGYVGLAYYEAHADKLQAVAVAEKEGGEYVTPSLESVRDGSYSPLGRPLFIYVSKQSLGRPEVREFVRFYARRSDLVAQVQYVPLSALQEVKERQKLQAALQAVTGP